MTELTIPDPTLVAQYVTRYRAGIYAVQDALAGATEVDLDRPGADADAWTARMVVHHLADSETNSFVRVRRLLAEPAGVLISGYDEATWAKKLAYDRPIDTSLAVFIAVRSSTLELLDALLPTLGDDVWLQVGTHSESGDYTLLDWLRIYAEHGEDHAAQIDRAVKGVA